MARAFEERDAALARRREKAPSTGSQYLGFPAAKAPKTPPNYFLGYQGTRSDADGYAFESMGRDLFGPLELRFQVGNFDPKAAGDTGSACLEFDMRGSDPLVFLAVCGRFVSGGVQVFAQSNTGPQGNTFLSGTRVAEVLVTYDGAVFTCKAKPRGSPDFLYTTFATYGWAQGETPLVLGYGASGLRKGAEVGLDEIYLRALPGDL